MLTLGFADDLYEDLLILIRSGLIDSRRMKPLVKMKSNKSGYHS